MTLGIFHMDSILYLDVETNGHGSFRPAKQRIVQLAYLIGDVEVSRFIKDVQYVNPQVPHPYDVNFLRSNGDDFNEVIDEFGRHLKNCTHIVAHNIKFDLGCIVNEFIERSGGKSNQIYGDEKFGPLLEEMNKKTLYDTMLSTVNICKMKSSKHSTSYKWPRLEELYDHLFKNKPDYILHDALNDCKVTRECLEELTSTSQVILPNITLPKQVRFGESCQ